LVDREVNLPDILVDREVNLPDILVDREVNLPVFSTLFYSATYSSLLVKIGITEEIFHFLLDKVFYPIILFKGIEIMSC